MGDTRFLFDDVLENKLTIDPVDKDALKVLQGKWDKVAKPIGSFGTFENVYSKIAAIQGFEREFIVRVISMCLGFLVLILAAFAQLFRIEWTKMLKVPISV